MSLLQNNIKSQLLELLQVLSNADCLINCHVASFITEDLWSKALNTDLQLELKSFNNFGQFYNSYLQILNDENSTAFKEYPNIKNFLRAPLIVAVARNNSCVTQLSEIENKFNHLNIKMRPPPRLKDFMSEKKIHEVTKMVPLAGALSEFTKTLQVVDIGGGKGYLSNALIKHWNVNILSLDSSSLTTCGAEKMKKKMDKISNQEDSAKGHCFHDTVLVEKTTDLSHLLRKNTKQSVVNTGLLGLHTCGDLATTCLHLFLQPDVRWIINVGCCYHLIEEEFFKHQFWDDLEINSSFGFPACNFLQSSKVKLGRNARMLAAHSLNRIAQHGIDEKSARSLYYRALLQIIVERARGHKLVEGKVGRLAKKCDSFIEYIRRGMHKLQLNHEITDDEILSLLDNYADEEIKLRIFFLLRTHFALAIESVILLDRLLFLLEQGVENAYLVPLFDPVISPRNHAIVAWKSQPL